MLDYSGDARPTSVVHPGRYYLSDKYPERVRRKVEEICGSRNSMALTAEEHIQEEEYEMAMGVIQKMIDELESMKPYIKEESQKHSDGDVEDSHNLYRNLYVNVSNKAYHARIVRTAEENGYEPSVIGALRSIEEDLRDWVHT